MMTRLFGLATVLVVAVGFAPAQAGAAPGSVQAALDTMTGEDGFPGALATVSDGGHRTFRSGVGDLSSRRPVPRDGRVRIGSATKTVLATVVLQLVDRDQIDLDAPVERYLPGLVRGNGNDGRKMHIRHLLQHTSGVPDYAAHMLLTPEDKVAQRYRQFSQKELLDLALSHEPAFQPGDGWEYSSTGYLLLGMVIEKVTGHSWQHEVTKRVIKPLHLNTMYLPRAKEYDLRGPHPRGYLTMSDPSRLVDITRFDQSAFGAGGALVSTPRDYNRFLTALLEGKLLEPGTLAEMKQPIKAQLPWPDAEYGLGLIRTPLSCGGYFYGHHGDVPGYTTMSGLAVDEAGRTTGRSATVTVTRLPENQDQGMHLVKTVDTALCDRPRS